jgi:hypothetical protein
MPVYCLFVESLTLKTTKPSRLNREGFVVLQILFLLDFIP